MKNHVQALHVMPRAQFQVLHEMPFQEKLNCLGISRNENVQSLCIIPDYTDCL